MSKKKNILFIVSNTGELGDTPCGICLEEFVIPYLKFLQENFYVTICSPKGGKSFISPSGLHNIKKEWEFVHEVLKRTECLDNIDENIYDALYLPGGQAALVDLPNNQRVVNIIKKYYAENKPIAAISHGLAALTGIFLEEGIPLLKDKEVCAFSNKEEREQFKPAILPFSLEDKLKEQGAIIKYPDSNEPIVVNCENIISGQNKLSSERIANEIIKILNNI